MLNVGIVGATGYAGEELIDILLDHKRVRITFLAARKQRNKAIDEIYPRFKNRISILCDTPNIGKLAAKCDLIFLAMPHTASMDLAPKLLAKGKKVIDLSADYRLKNAKIYEKFYKVSHKDKKSLAKAVYGLPELNRAKIKSAKLVANPGCYPTAAILALTPLLALGLVDPKSIIIDAKSGASGAGRKAVEELSFCEVSGDFRAYKINSHQHAPEINQELTRAASCGVKVIFVPHLLPVKRGILETIYLKKLKNSSQNLTGLYKKFYKNEPFIRIKENGLSPSIKDVLGTNFCDISIKDEGDNIIVIAAIDNLLKGASGQAVQNMNIIYGFPEQTGLL